MTARSQKWKYGLMKHPSLLSLQMQWKSVWLIVDDNDYSYIGLGGYVQFTIARLAFNSFVNCVGEMFYMPPYVHYRDCMWYHLAAFLTCTHLSLL